MFKNIYYKGEQISKVFNQQDKVLSVSMLDTVAWYDPSDLSTMFQDKMGTTPVTAVGQPVGLILDKSKSNSLKNLIPSLAVSSVGTSEKASYNKETGEGTIIRGVDINNHSSVGLSNTTPRFLSIDIENTGEVALQLRTNNASTIVYTIQPQERKKVHLYTDVTKTWIMCAVSSSTTSFKLYSLDEIPGNHAFQETSAARPILSETVNIFRDSIPMSDSTWSLVNVELSTTDEITPFNTKAALFTKTATEVSCYASHNLSKKGHTISKSYISSFLVKAVGEAKYFTIRNQEGYPSRVDAVFDIEEGVVVKEITYDEVTTGKADIAAIGDGWFLCTLTCETIGDTNSQTLFSFHTTESVADTKSAFISSGLVGYADQRNNFKDVLKYGTQFKSNNTVSGGSGTFPKYLSFDGVDDRLVTLPLDMSDYLSVNILSAASKSTEKEGQMFTGVNTLTGMSDYRIMRGGVEDTQWLLLGVPGVPTSVSKTSQMSTGKINFINARFTNVTDDTTTLRLDGKLIVHPKGASTNSSFGTSNFYIGGYNTAYSTLNLYELYLIGGDMPTEDKQKIEDKLMTFIN